MTTPPCGLPRAPTRAKTTAAPGCSRRAARTPSPRAPPPPSPAWPPRVPGAGLSAARPQELRAASAHGSHARLISRGRQALAQRFRLRCWRAALAFARRFRSVTAGSRLPARGRFEVRVGGRRHPAGVTGDHERDPAQQHDRRHDRDQDRFLIVGGAAFPCPWCSSCWSWRCRFLRPLSASSWSELPPTAPAASGRRERQAAAPTASRITAPHARSIDLVPVDDTRTTRRG